VRRLAVVLVVALVVLMAMTVAALVFVLGDRSSSRVGNSPEPSSADSAAGKPCVALADPLPPDAPVTPGIVGPAPTELVTQDIVPGTGATVTATGQVTVKYLGVACSTGKIFASSYGTGGPVAVPLDQVIPGFGQGVSGMKVGGVRLIAVPSDQAYGSAGVAPLVAPDEAVWFVVEVTDDAP
jgi:peptidylprolyl isomerase